MQSGRIKIFIYVNPFSEELKDHYVGFCPLLAPLLPLSSSERPLVGHWGSGRLLPNGWIFFLLQLLT